jgi:hypothetical protein
MHELKFTAIYEEADEGGYIGYVAELPGANTQVRPWRRQEKTSKRPSNYCLTVIARMLR